jgi:hypothetical protein
VGLIGGGRWLKEEGKKEADEPFWRGKEWDGGFERIIVRGVREEREKRRAKKRTPTVLIERLGDSRRMRSDQQ